MKKFESIGIGIPQVLLPKKGIDPTKWAIVACDQFTSEPEYWKEVEQFVGDAPSTLHLIYPELYLSEANPDRRIASIRSKMDEYLNQNVFKAFEGIVYVEREAAGKTRKGMVLCVDLQRYDYHKGSSSLIRATEGTILERIPPRVRIRKGASLELPHIMILIDDPQNTVIGPLSQSKNKLLSLYDFELMKKSGRLSGYLVEDTALENGVVNALENLADPRKFAEYYDLAENTPVLLFAMGDGNHSLATAKAIWEKVKEDAADEQAVMDDLRRFALVEIVNVHDEALVFEPIHRVLFELSRDRELLAEMEAHYAGRFGFSLVGSLDEMISRVDNREGPHLIGVIRPEGYGIIEISNPDSILPVGSLQLFLDKFLDDGGAQEIDYVHGTTVVDKLGHGPGNIGFYLPAMNKDDLFKTVILDGALPRKTFSMGEAEEKRFYMECRKLK